MGEDEETPKGDGSVDSSTKFPASDHTENMADALARAKESVGEKAGLSGALAARMDSMSAASRRFADRWSLEHPNASSRSVITKVNHFMGVEMYFLPAKAVEKASGFLRDRLRPKQSVDQIPNTAKGSK